MLLMYFFSAGLIFTVDNTPADNIQNGLVITEIMADPTPSYGLPEAEYLEVFNGSPSSMNLSDYTVNDGSVRTISDLVIAPGEYAIICDDDDTSEFTTYGNVAWVSSLSLTNSGEAITLCDLAGTVMDSIYYSVNWFGSSFKEDGGWSLERVDTDFHCTDPANWAPSEALDGGTPGKLNSKAGIFIDDAPPVILHAYPLNATEVVVCFSEEIERIYPHQIDCSLPGPVINSDYYNGSRNKILVTFVGPMMPSFEYEMTFYDVQDCPGNTNQSDTIRFGLPSHNSGNRLRINEVLYDPEAGCPEYIEVINVSDSIIDLSDYEICRLAIPDGTIESVYKITDTPYLLFSEDPIYLSEDVRAVASCHVARFPESALLVGDLPSLVNSGGRIGVMYLGELIDDIEYNDQMHHPLLFTSRGVALELMDAHKNEFLHENWMSASSVSGYGTPGYANSQATGVSETTDWFEVVPESFSPDNNGQNDFTTLILNHDGPGHIAAFRIYDINGQLVRSFQTVSIKTGTNRFTWQGDNDEGKVLAPGPYIIHVAMIGAQGQKKSGKRLAIITEY